MGVPWGDPWMVAKGKWSTLFPDWEMLWDKGTLGQEIQRVEATDLWSKVSTAAMGEGSGAVLSET